MHVDPLPPLIGGALIGLAASLYLLTHGRVAGISGILGGALGGGTDDRTQRFAFLAGLLVAGLGVRIVHPAAFESRWTAGLLPALVAGVLVGLGTQLGNGCTSGHGVCGLSRGSVRSILATVTFMLAGGATVFVVRHVLGGGR